MKSEGKAEKNPNFRTIFGEVGCAVNREVNKILIKNYHN